MPTVVFETYWRFAHLRQEIYYGRLRSLSPPWTSDSILSTYRFTNAFRAADRVSQYLISEVIYHDDHRSDTADDIVLRVLLFKIFNRIETWELLRERVGRISAASFEPKRYARVLEEEMTAGRPIYSAAYIMPSPRQFGASRKHENHLALLAQMISDRVGPQLADAANMRSAFSILRAYPGIGDFLAYQYVTDLNYSELTAFSENDFVVPGPGAREGIRKAFSSTAGRTDADVIRIVSDAQEEHFARLDLPFQDLFGRPLMHIDCQNLFCEVAKYSRVAHPGFTAEGGRKRIKQRFRAKGQVPRPWFPPKWGINGQVTEALDRQGEDKWS